jgi:Na+-driven multidrug efflux pump
LFLDCGVLWLVGIPLAALFSMVLHIPSIVIFFLLIQLEGVVRIIIGMTRFFSFKWIHNVTELVEK